TACGKTPSGEAAKTATSETAKTYSLSPEDNKRFLADYAARGDVKKTADGLLYRVVKAGTGAMPIGPNDQVTVYYKGNTIDGKVFDQTDPGQPRTFPAGMLIPGWVEALSMMKEGDEWELVIPSQLGYGSTGAGDTIKPDQTLVFSMTLLKVQHAQ
ncbi:MAG TPA: FKBP-type peptidyl-prolyl cis-trans isomerase, partial [Alphaproteobacteria bacterium]|nr:FKBP-type peptidyl-prolyl cis-trans isomerase [Alphaproteobacteria bacterium]